MDETLRDNYIWADKSDNWMYSSPRLWALLNHSVPLVVVVNGDGSCEFPWLRTSHPNGWTGPRLAPVGLRNRQDPRKGRARLTFSDREEEGPVSKSAA